MAKDTPLYDEPTGGRIIAKFTGNNVPMALSEIPKDPQNERSKLLTSTGNRSVRLEGFITTPSLSFYTTRDIPVLLGNVWIASAYKVKLVGATSSNISVELSVAGTQGQKVRASTVCDAVALQRGTPVGMQIVNNERGYMSKESSIALYDEPNGSAMFSLQMIEGATQLFWSTESRAGYVHVKARADLVLDGWIPFKSLDPLKKGEMVDQYIPPPPAEVAGAQLVFDKPPRVATATKDILIRARRNDRERPIGVVESGAEIYVLETVAGWTNILPKSLHILPADDGGFWIPSSETP